MHPGFFSDKFATALPYDRDVATGTDEQRLRWQTFHDAVPFGDAHRKVVTDFTREMKVLVVSGMWCGDCVQQCPLLEHIARACRGCVDLRFLDRDQNRDLMDRFRINGGDRVPVALFLAEDFELCSVFGDRTLSRYRAIARKQLGASCPTGIGGPDPDEVSHTLGEWLDEFERVELMLRLSPRLRQKHGD